MAYGRIVRWRWMAATLRLGVVELEAVGAVAAVGRVDLELQPDDEPVSGFEPVVAEHDASVASGLADRRGLDRVDLHALHPAVVEHEPRMLERAPRRMSTRAWKNRPPRTRGRGQRRPAASVAPWSATCLPEHIEQAEHRDHGEDRHTARRAHSPTVPAWLGGRGDLREQARHPPSIRGARALPAEQQSGS